MTMTTTTTTTTTSSSSSIGIGIGIGIGCPSVSLNAFPTTATTSLRFKYVLKAKAKAKAKAAAAHTQTTQQQQQQQQQEEQGQYNLNHNKVASASAGAGDSDPDLRAVLEIATSSELYELQQILFGPSYLSPLLKSVSVTNALPFDRFMIDHDFQHRHLFITSLESRFLFLAADARSTLRGWRPSYRNILLDVRKLLNIPCSTTLPPEDLELEIFIKIIHGSSSSSSSSRVSDTTAPALTLGPAQLCSALLKGGQLLSLLKISQLVSTNLSREMLLKAAKHKFGSNAIKKGLTGATSRYLGLHSLASLFGPMLWGTFLADVVIQMLGTDYIRILQAIYALAQIRILRRHGLHLDKLETGF